MATKYALGKLSNVPWGALKTAAYDVIIESLDDNAAAQTVKLTDEDDKTVMVVPINDNEREIKISCTVKGTNHLGVDGLVGSILTTELADADVPSPCIVVSNSAGRRKSNWMVCEATVLYIGADAVSQTLNTSPLNTTT